MIRFWWWLVFFAGRIIMPFLFIRASSSLSAGADVLEPARVSCNAAYSAPCARTNAKYLAITTSAQLQKQRRQGQEESSKMTIDELAQRITNKEFNMDTGFYPFVFDRLTHRCLAHGADSQLLNLTLEEILGQTGLGFQNVTALHQRFVDAGDRGGDWVRYHSWSDNKQPKRTLAFVVPLGPKHYLGVGYEARQLPTDLPCSHKHDSLCSITNALSLVGAVQIRLNHPQSLEDFEAGLFEVSYNQIEYQVPGGFYSFVYSHDGPLVAHAHLHDSFGLTLGDILVKNRIGTKEEGMDLHKKFIAAAEGADNGWVQYEWRNSLDEPTYTKIAFLVKIEFGGKSFYAGTGFNFQMDSTTYGPLGTNCTAAYNSPCSFRTSLQLASHSLAHALSSPLPVNEMFRALTEDPMFIVDDFYVFIYDFKNMTCVAHGQTKDHVGKTLVDIFRPINPDFDAVALHDEFVQAAEQGSGWVLYDWLVPDVNNSHFQKISYIFRLTIDGQDYYGGVGFNHTRYPTREFAEEGKRMDGQKISCTAKHGFNCSEINPPAIVGQALAKATLALKEGLLEQVFSNITNQADEFRINDFYTMVFSVDGTRCQVQDGSGCCVAHGLNPSMVELTWHQILEEAKITSIRGLDLHQSMISASNQMGGSFTYSFATDFGTAQTKKAWAARLRNAGHSFYIVAETLLTPPPPPCDDCPNNMTCTHPSQEYCIEKKQPEEKPIDNPEIMALVIIFCLIVPASIALMCTFWFQKKTSKLKMATKEAEAASERIRLLAGRVVEATDNLPVANAETYRRITGTDLEAERVGQVLWYWKEDPHYLSSHKSFMILEDTDFVQYSSEVSGQIEYYYQLWKEGNGDSRLIVDLSDKITSTATGLKAHNADTGSVYEIDFEALVQRNVNNNHERTVHWKVFEVLVQGTLPPLPEDVDFSDGGQHLLPIFVGQVIRVLEARGGWLFGRTLYNPIAADMENPYGRVNNFYASLVQSSPTSGWFPECVSQKADEAMELEMLRIPRMWIPDREGPVELAPDAEECKWVRHFFLHGLPQAEITKIERIQNKSLCQAYDKKKQEMKLRDTTNPQDVVNNKGDVERWLFHGTSTNDIERIGVEGFDRSFAGGTHGARHGSGVYFATSSSGSNDFCEECDGIRRMLVCRVLVGDWCLGTNGQQTPDLKPNNERFDTTVDDVQTPSIFVVYHDAQAYPAYCVEFENRQANAPAFP